MTFPQSINEYLMKELSSTLQDSSIVIAAVSGGADSMAMLHWLQELRQTIPFMLVACHVHHGIRGSSADRDAALVEQFSLRYKIDFELVYVNVLQQQEAYKESVETTARRLRYEALQQVADRYGTCTIITAHHRSDQVETVLFHFLRGTGVSGLRGMPQKRSLGRHHLFRLFLSLSKQDLREYVTVHDVPFAEDETNQDKTYSRNRIRHELLPYLRANYNPQVDEAILRLGEVSAQEDDYLLFVTRTFIEQNVTLEKESVSCSLSSFSGLARALQRRCIKLLLEYLEPSVTWRFSQVEDIRLLASGLGSHRLSCGHGYDVLREYGRFRISRAVSHQESIVSFAPVTLDWSSFFCLAKFRWIVQAQPATAPKKLIASKWEVWFERQKGDQIVLRSFAVGDRIEPLGMQGSKRLSDVFIDAKVPKEMREGYPVLLINDQVLFVPGLVRSRHRLLSGIDRGPVQYVCITPQI